MGYDGEATRCPGRGASPCGGTAGGPVAGGAGEGTGGDSQPPEEALCEEKRVFLTTAHGFGDKMQDHLSLRPSSPETPWLWAAPVQMAAGGARASARPESARLLVSWVASLGPSRRLPSSQGGRACWGGPPRGLEGHGCRAPLTHPCALSPGADARAILPKKEKLKLRRERWLQSKCIPRLPALSSLTPAP